MNTFIAFIMGLFGFTKKAESTGNNNNQPNKNGVMSKPQLPDETITTRPTLSELVEQMSPLQALQMLRISEVRMPKVIRRLDGSLKVVHVESNRNGKPHSFKVRKVHNGTVFIQRINQRRGPITTRPLSIFE